jgi:hypothetical protein
MSDDPNPQSEPRTQLFAAPAPEPNSLPKAAILIAVAGGILILAVVFFLSRGHKPVAPGTILPLDPAAVTLPISDVVMSESTSLSGGKSTFIDGHIHNTGPKAVTAINVQVLFRNDVAMPPQVETLPLSLIRTREPYIDTQPVSAAPIAPNEDREFRLIFENINANWNVQIPEIHITGITTR